MNEILAAICVISVPALVLVLMFMVTYRRHQEFKKRQYKANMKKRLKIIKGDKFE